MSKFSNRKPDQTAAQAITRAMNGGAPLTKAERATLTPAELAGVDKIIAQTNASIKAGKSQAVTDPRLTGVPRGPKLGSARSNQSVKYSKGRLPDYGAPLQPGESSPFVPGSGSGREAAKALAEPKSRRNVVAENKAATAKALNETNKRKPTQTQNKPGMVVGHPNVATYKGKGATPRSIAALVPANRGADTLAILNDGSTHPITRMVGAGLKVKVGDVFSAVCAAYTTLQVAEDAKRQAAPKGPAVLAKGAEGEVHSRKAAHDSRAKAAPAKAEKAKAAPKGGKNKQPSAGLDYAYKMGRKFDRKAGTWTEHMVRAIQAHKNTADAKAAHAKGKAYSDKKLDFSWALAQGFIKR